ncbi:MAG: hypothetical protein HY903_07815 [Deltaproteobacteria bacterium]|nr:hypothetical protein [Deltaproteobacteria bacterium]
MKRVTGLVFLGVLGGAVACSDAGEKPRGYTGGREAGFGVVEQSRSVTHPGRFLESDGGAGPNAPMPLEMAQDASAGLAYDDSCVESVDAGGLITYSCDFDGVACVEVYTAAGDLISWSCDGYGSYVCAYTAELVTCTYTDPNGGACVEIFTRDWALVESSCYQEPGEECVANGDGTTTCAYDDGYWACTYTFDAANVLLAERCTSADGTVECVGDAETATCDYDFPGYLACSETYAVAFAWGLVASDCDWDQNGAPDCVTTDAGLLACVYSDGTTSCDIVLRADGSLESEACVDDSGTFRCTRSGDQLACASEYGRDRCTFVVDLAFNVLSESCELVPECAVDADCVALYGNDYVCAAGSCSYADPCAGAWLDETSTCRAPNDGVYPAECCADPCFGAFIDAAGVCRAPNDGTYPAECCDQWLCGGERGTGSGDAMPCYNGN